MARIKVEDWLTEDGLQKIELYKKRGLTDKQIAAEIGISERTFTKWKKENDSIVTALKKGRTSGVDRVEHSMFEQAIGYTDKDGVYHAPNTTAGIFILKNLRRVVYQDKPKTPEELESIRLDNEIKRLKLDELKQLVGGDNPILTTLKEYLEAFDEA